MPRRIDKGLIDITQPFTIVVEKSIGDDQMWVSKIIGIPGGVQVGCDPTPEGAVYMAWDIVRIMTGRCSIDRLEHEYTVDTVITPPPGSATADIPAWGCAHCDVKTAKSMFIEDTIH